MIKIKIIFFALILFLNINGYTQLPEPSYKINKTEYEKTIKNINEYFLKYETGIFSYNELKIMVKLELFENKYMNSIINFERQEEKLIDPIEPNIKR